jgi:hypothetical protein
MLLDASDTWDTLPIAEIRKTGYNTLAQREMLLASPQSVIKANLPLRRL